MTTDPDPYARMEQLRARIARLGGGQVDGHTTRMDAALDLVTCLRWTREEEDALLAEEAEHPEFGVHDERANDDIALLGVPTPTHGGGTEKALDALITDYPGDSLHTGAAMGFLALAALVNNAVAVGAAAAGIDNHEMWDRLIKAIADAREEANSPESRAIAAEISRRLGHRTVVY